MKTNAMVPQSTIYSTYKHKHQIPFDHNNTKMKTELCKSDRFFHQIQVI